MPWPNGNNNNNGKLNMPRSNFVCCWHILMADCGLYWCTFTAWIAMHHRSTSILAVAQANIRFGRMFVRLSLTCAGSQIYHSYAFALCQRWQRIVDIWLVHCLRIWIRFNTSYNNCQALPMYVYIHIIYIYMYSVYSMVPRLA